MSRNVFEENDPIVTDEEALKYGDKMAAVLPKLGEDEYYEVVDLSNGKTGIVRQQVDPVDFPSTESCGCGLHQGCVKCGKYQGTGENSPESVELRHG